MTDGSHVRFVFRETSIFTRLAGEHLPDDELNAMQWALMAGPERGDLIRGSGGHKLVVVVGSQTSCTSGGATQV